jgi:transposase-like protein
MEHCARKPGDEKEIPEFSRDSIEQAMRLRIRDTIEDLVKEELDAALGAPKSARVGEQRQGYCHGLRERTLTTSLGPATFAMPLTARHLARPVLAIIDGNPGLMNALQSHWPGIAIQRCTAHKLWNLQSKAPARLREELTEDYRRMIYGDTVATVQQERTRFTKKWQLRCPAVVDSLKEAATNCSRFCAFLRRSGRRFGRRTLSSASTRSSAAAPRRRRVCQGRTRWCCCSSACCVAARSNCGCLMAIEI